MSMSSLKVLKYVVFFFNLLFWVCGCTILGFGIYFLIKNSFGSLFYSLPSLTLGNVVIIVGSIIMVIAFLGCMGSIKENKCLLMSFFILLLFILLMEVIMAILLFAYEQKIDHYVANDLSQSIQRYKSDNNTKMAWDEIQQHLECCGVNSTSDWKGHLPESCPKDPKTQGCYAKAKLWFQSNFLYIGILIISVCVIQVLGMSFALTLNCQIEKNSQSLGI
ncbi:leukocyte surface antigen CD53 [Monodelphis domestica]|uniref:Tetraspanin n=1 Tax=Monodelphis domestica TaxID=13616 RepID=A0A5F8HE98_MONDO|nr:leukocyte surface antigen CD53 [Monodelphis domestica]XP_056675170.1 leukocyte surface antigen CD53 [Monodelphis domestica]